MAALRRAIFFIALLFAASSAHAQFPPASGGLVTQGGAPWRFNAQSGDIATGALVDIYNGSPTPWDSLSLPGGTPTYTLMNALLSIYQVAKLPVLFPVNITPTGCASSGVSAGTITAGGTAQNLSFSSLTNVHGVTLMNTDPSAGGGEVLWYSFTTTAALNTDFPLPPPASATTYAGAGSWTSPAGFGFNHNISIYAATTGHKFSCTYW